MAGPSLPVTSRAGGQTGEEDAVIAANRRTFARECDIEWQNRVVRAVPRTELADRFDQAGHARLTSSEAPLAGTTAPG